MFDVWLTSSGCMRNTHCSIFQKLSNCVFKLCFQKTCKSFYNKSAMRRKNIWQTSKKKCVLLMITSQGCLRFAVLNDVCAVFHIHCWWCQVFWVYLESEFKVRRCEHNFMDSTTSLEVGPGSICNTHTHKCDVEASDALHWERIFQWSSRQLVSAVKADLINILTIITWCALRLFYCEFHLIV